MLLFLPHPCIMSFDCVLRKVPYMGYKMILASIYGIIRGRYSLYKNVQYSFFFLLLVVLHACTYNISQPASKVDTTNSAVLVTTTKVSTPTATSAIQFVQASPTPRSIIQDQAILESRAFENGLPLVARVNDKPVFLDTYQKQVDQFKQALQKQELDITSPEGQDFFRQIQEQILENLLDQIIIEQQANSLGITITDNEVEARANEVIAQLAEPEQLETWLVDNQLTYQEFVVDLRGQLISNKVFEYVTQNTPNTADQVWLHLIKVANQETADKVVFELQQGQDFAAVAQSYSTDESAVDGGDLGWFSKNVTMVPAKVEDIAFLLRPGEISGSINTSSGFYIIKLKDKAVNKPLSNNLLDRLKKQIFSQWLIEQRSSTTIEKFIVL